MSTAWMRALAVCVGLLCVVGVVAGVVATGRDGSVIDLLALVAVAAFVLAWRLHRHSRQAPLAD